MRFSLLVLVGFRLPFLPLNSLGFIAMPLEFRMCSIKIRGDFCGALLRKQS